MVNLGEVWPEKEDKMQKERYKPLPDGWWKDVDWINLKDHEPTTYELLFDFFINKMACDPETVMHVSQYVPRSVLIVTKHPKRGIEYARFRLSPATVVEGSPDPGSNVEVDAVITYDNYYHLVRSLLGDYGMGDPSCDGFGSIVGNYTALIDLRDGVHTAQHEESPFFKFIPLGLAKEDQMQSKERPIPKRPLMWPDGHP